MKHLTKISDNPEDSFHYFLSDHQEPLLEYVNIIAQKYRPASIHDLEAGFDMPAQGYFLTRYFEKLKLYNI